MTCHQVNTLVPHHKSILLCLPNLGHFRVSVFYNIHDPCCAFIPISPPFICDCTDSMLELGCGITRACNFVRRLSVRYQFPLSLRITLIQHLTKKRTNEWSHLIASHRAGQTGSSIRNYIDTAPDKEKELMFHLFLWQQTTMRVSFLDFN